MVCCSGAGVAALRESGTVRRVWDPECPPGVCAFSVCVWTGLGPGPVLGALTTPAALWSQAVPCPNPAGPMDPGGALPTLLTRKQATQDMIDAEVRLG